MEDRKKEGVVTIGEEFEKMEELKRQERDKKQGVIKVDSGDGRMQENYQMADIKRIEVRRREIKEP